MFRTSAALGWFSGRSTSVATHHSTVKLGTDFEILTQNLLTQSARFTLTRSGGANDHGIDLSGTWNINVKKAYPVIIQCKFEAGKLGTRYLRELEGSLTRKEASTIGFLVSRNSIEYANTSPKPLILLTIRHASICFYHANPKAEQIIPLKSIMRNRKGSAHYVVLMLDKQVFFSNDPLVGEAYSSPPGFFSLMLQRIFGK